MMEEIIAISTAALCGAAVGAGCLGIIMRGEMDMLRSENDSLRSSLRTWIDDEKKRQAQRLAASRRAAELRRQRAEVEAKEAPERRKRTIEALSNTKLRSRAQVVASVKAKRTKQKKSAGGVAPSKAG